MMHTEFKSFLYHLVHHFKPLKIKTMNKQMITGYAKKIETGHVNTCICYLCPQRENA